MPVETSSRSLRKQLTEIYSLLLQQYGPQHWWPADSPFEVIVGAILTQSAAWANVERAIRNLSSAGALSPARLRELPQSELAQLVYPSGYFNAKALKLKAFAQHLGDNYQDSLDKLFGLDMPILRRELLAIHGVGEETADSIILYAGRKPIFVIDAYTRRIFARLGLEPSAKRYADFQKLFMGNLPLDEGMFNEYHALIVRHGKEVCRRAPRCDACCLRERCVFTGITKQSRVR
jgi:endonuclease-3 related protein